MHVTLRRRLRSATGTIRLPGTERLRTPKQWLYGCISSPLLFHIRLEPLRYGNMTVVHSGIESGVAISDNDQHRVEKAQVLV